MPQLPNPPHPPEPQPAEATRTQQQLTVTTEVVPVRRAVLHVETVSEQVMVPVTLTRQQVRVEYDDIDPATAARVLAGQQLDGAVSDWLVLTADEPVITARPVPVERVRLATSWVNATAAVQTQLTHDDVRVETTDIPGAPHHA
ncbi:DUF2382 domain-containing protein [Klenkia sp. PcliD-1-E]|uniref:DUF2382 domain-containing protein n=1 Tax=Klenkia sp. PcliD-1-E TaxID=2954492 RepID=UPI002096F89D|nr:DUF2382 domain-containing protein [Klenkia sp. PcliD-1-E]MCO7218340.1 YsnF/AvaK domain-containing protein [Klenkia sp. PcliD-1-E]